MRLSQSQAISSSARSSQATFRNRRLLSLAAAAVPIASFIVWLTTTPGSAPLLLSLDEVSLRSRDGALTSAAGTFATSNVFLPSANAGLFSSFISPRNTTAQSTPEMMAAPIIAETEAEFASASDQDGDSSEVRWFNGRPIRPVRTIEMVTTAYSPDARSCGEFADNITASGLSVWTNAMKLAAADTNVLPLGSLISVPGYDQNRVVPVLDRGGAIKGNRLDLLYPTHEQAMRWGVQRLEVTVWEYADGRPNDFVPRFNRASSVNP